MQGITQVKHLITKATAETHKTRERIIKALPLNYLTHSIHHTANEAEPEQQKPTLGMIQKENTTT